MKNPVKMTQNALTRLAHDGKYPFCHTCGCEIVADMVVDRRRVTYPDGITAMKYFCPECVRTGRMYAVGKGKED